MLGSDDDEYFRIEDVKFLTRVAARVGNLGLVRRLFDAFRLSRRHEETFAGAAEGGHVFIIEHLLTERDAFIPVDRVFELAAGRGRVELLRFLLDNGMRPETPRSRARRPLCWCGAKPPGSAKTTASRERRKRLRRFS